MALANTTNQTAGRYTIQGHNILNEQDGETKNTVLGVRNDGFKS